MARIVRSSSNNSRNNYSYNRGSRQELKEDYRSTDDFDIDFEFDEEDNDGAYFDDDISSYKDIMNDYDDYGEPIMQKKPIQKQTPKTKVNPAPQTTNDYLQAILTELYKIEQLLGHNVSSSVVSGVGVSDSSMVMSDTPNNTDQTINESFNYLSDGTSGSMLAQIRSAIGNNIGVPVGEYNDRVLTMENTGIGGGMSNPTLVNTACAMRQGEYDNDLDDSFMDNLVDAITTPNEAYNPMNNKE